MPSSSVSIGVLPQHIFDFDFRFYNGAHPDLQAKGYLQGDEPVELTHLTPEGKMRFPLPGVRPFCSIQRVDHKELETIAMNLDTIFIEPDERTFCLVWRANTGLDELSDETIQQVTIAVEKASSGPRSRVK